MFGHFKKQRSKPAYVQNRERASCKKRESQQYKDNVEMIRALNRVADQLVTDEQQEERRDGKKACREILTIVLVFATVVAAGIGDIFFYGQMQEMRNAYRPLVRQSTAGRAYLFIKPEFVMEDTQSIGPNAARDTYRPSIRFSIKNFGQTPAIITAIKTHLYLTNGMATDDPPEPDSAEGKASVDLGRPDIRPTDFINSRSDFTTIDSTGENPARIVFVGGDESGSLTATFLFLKRRKLQWGWFYCEVVYQDIFSELRHTWLYARVGGTGFSYPKSEKYNHWD